MDHSCPDGGWGIASPVCPKQTFLSFRSHQVATEAGYNRTVWERLPETLKN